MKLNYLGHSAFLLTADCGTRIVTDPYAGIGYPMPHAEADYAVCSHLHGDHANVRGVSGIKQAITQAGGYELGGFKVTGFPAWHDEAHGAKRGAVTVFVYEADGFRVCHMGDIGQAPTPELLEKIGSPDVLCIPVGGVYTVDADGAAEYVKLIRPKIVVPIHYHLPGGTLGIAPVDGFLRCMGAENCIHMKELRLPCAEAEGKTVVLEVLA